MLRFEVARLSERGGRKRNEDACAQWQGGRHLLCVLADGAGGHGGGDIAARLAVSEIVGRFSQQPSTDGADLGALLRQANLALIDARVPGTPRQDMHSTAVCLAIDLVAQRAHWAHAGDSRMYWFRAARIVERTRDHSLAQSLVDAGALAPERLRGHPRRSELRSALGVADAALEVASGDGRGRVEPGDVFMLCSDGLWEHLPDAELERTLAAARSPADWLAELERLVRRNARPRAGHDNFTALVACIGTAA